MNSAASSMLAATKSSLAQATACSALKRQLALALERIADLGIRSAKLGVFRLQLLDSLVAPVLRHELTSALTAAGWKASRDHGAKSITYTPPHTAGPP